MTWKEDYGYNGFKYECKKRTMKAEIVACIAHNGDEMQVDSTDVKNGMKRICVPRGDGVLYYDRPVDADPGTIGTFAPRPTTTTTAPQPITTAPPQTTVASSVPQLNSTRTQPTTTSTATTTTTPQSTTTAKRQSTTPSGSVAPREIRNFKAMSSFGSF